MGVAWGNAKECVCGDLFSTSSLRDSAVAESWQSIH